MVALLPGGLTGVRLANGDDSQDACGARVVLAMPRSRHKVLASPGISELRDDEPLGRTISEFHDGVLAG